MIYASTGRLPFLNRSLSIGVEGRGERSADVAVGKAYEAANETVADARKQDLDAGTFLDDLLRRPSIHALDQK